MEEESRSSCRQKETPRKEEDVRRLRNRLNRIAGQLNGIGRMLEENRHCADILTQVAAVESALQAFGFQLLQEHMETCVAEDIKKGGTAELEEAMELMRKLK